MSHAIADIDTEIAAFKATNPDWATNVVSKLYIIELQKQKTILLSQTQQQPSGI